MELGVSEVKKPESIDRIAEDEIQVLSKSEVGAVVDLIATDLRANVESPLVAVLLCTRNGARFLEEQLNSLRAQEHKNFNLWVSDDGSEDNTNHILEQNQPLPGNIPFAFQNGPQKGFVKNFHSLICKPNILADYFAYADQDDIWQPDKLSRAIAMLEHVPIGTPAIYCSRTRLIDESGEEIGFSPLFEKPTSFENALVQNVGGGNTMVMNKAARDLLCETGGIHVVSHDWWAYTLIAGAGGTVIYDSNPSVGYRQHDNNMVGSNNDWPSRLSRLWWLLKGRFRTWNTINTKALQQVRHLLTPENQCILDEFSTARNRWLIPRIIGIVRSGIYRQTLMGNLGLMVAVVLKKL
jgi:glycosyltransferase involved in cell wall biosynthesis